MWITPNVDLPEDLLAADRAGELVYFVGAGCSHAPPSNLPLFSGLAKTIATEAHAPMGSDDHQFPDRFLGRIAADVDVHARVRALVDLPASLPNRQHRALARLAAGSHGRLVTTNYDKHLTTAANEGLGEFAEYFAPALPLGDNFSGVVYLHGALDDPHGRLVVTDGDFGSAYLTDAWAARFLERMFRRYVVVFVGYSHNDFIMQYLARGLAQPRQRFVMTDQPGSPGWNRLGITPIGYPSAEGDDHLELTLALEAWADRREMRLLDHRERIVELVSTSDLSSPDEHDYLRERVEDEQTVEFFTAAATDPRWLTWAEGLDAFPALFNEIADPSGTHRALARWFAGTFAADVDQTGAALQVLQRQGGALSAPLWAAVVDALGSTADSAARSYCVKWWMPVLLGAAPSRWATPMLEVLVSRLSMPDDRAAILLAFEYFSEPRVALRPDFLWSDSDAVGVRYELHFDAGDYLLDSIWREQVAPNLEACAADLVELMGHQLAKAHRLMRSVEAASRDSDMITWSRSSIAPHPQDSHRSAIDPVIDAARDSLAALAAQNRPEGELHLRQWIDAEAPVLRRIALHALPHFAATTPAAAMRTVIDRGLLYDFTTKTETFGLIAWAAPLVDEAVLDELVSHAELGPAVDAGADPSEDRRRSRRYEVYNALVWLATHAPDSPSVVAALARAKDRDQDFAPREHPDFDSWHSSGTFGPEVAIPVGELHELIASNPVEARRRILAASASRSRFEEPTWDDGIQTLAAVIAEHPLDGIAVLNWAGDDEEVQGFTAGTLQGWSRASSLDSPTATKMLRALVDSDRLPAHARAVARVLDALTRQEDLATPDVIAASRAVARKLGAAADPEEAPGASMNDILGSAINHWAGTLAVFWTRSASAQWQQDSDAWVGLPVDVRQPLEHLLNLGGDSGRYARAVAGGELHFFFSADEAWCEEVLLPLFDWTHPHAREVWAGFLFWGRTNPRLLDAGLMAAFLQAFGRADELTDRERLRLFQFFAAFVVRASDAQPAWLGQLIATGSDDQRTALASQIGHQLREVPPETATRRWDDWIREYWRARTNGLPRPLSGVEASAMAAWALELPDRMDEAADLVSAGPPLQTDGIGLLHRLVSGNFPTTHPQATARILKRILEGPAQPMFLCSHVQKLLEGLAAMIERKQLEALVELAVQQGCTNAPEVL